MLEEEMEGKGKREERKREEERGEGEGGTSKDRDHFLHAYFLIMCLVAVLAWTAIFVNSANPSAGVLPALVGLTLFDQGPGKQAKTALLGENGMAVAKLYDDLLTKKWCLIVFWSFTACMGLVAAPIMCGKPSTEATVDLSLAVYNLAEQDGARGAGFCGSLSCELPGLRYIKASGVLTQWYTCDQGAAECESEFATTEHVALVAELGDEIGKPTALRFQRTRLDVEFSIEVDDFFPLSVSIPNPTFSLPVVEHWNTTTCGTDFSLAMAKKTILSFFDTWVVRCGTKIFVGFVAAGDLEVGRQLQAENGQQCGDYDEVTSSTLMGERKETGSWWLSAESIRSIDDGFTELFVGKGLGGVGDVLKKLQGQTVPENAVASPEGIDPREWLLDSLLEIRWDGSDDTILQNEERQCFVNGGDEIQTIAAANKTINDFLDTEDYYEEIFSFGTFNWAKRSRPKSQGFNTGFSEASATDALALTSVVMLAITGLMLLVCLVALITSSKAIWADNLFSPKAGRDAYKHLVSMLAASTQIALLGGTCESGLKLALVALAWSYLIGVLLFIYLLLFILYERRTASSGNAASRTPSPAHSQGRAPAASV
ncbi:unnamed protein product [Chrysoparadoxa australica]